MSVERVEPPVTGSEREMLCAWLDFHRATLLHKCEGLGPEELSRAAVAPSDLSLLGLVRHLAEVERRWFQARFAGEEIEPLYPEGTIFSGAASADPEVDFANFAAACAASRAIVERTGSLDALAPRPSGRRNIQPSLRYVLMHLVEEYARHNGHADLIREVIDGTVGV
jgi:uncharacterized damage-inducible protein DinB